jgi:GTP-binding protein Era
VDALAALMPASPFLYDAEDASTQTLRFFATEAIREAAFEQLEEELPYAVTSEIEEFLEDRNPVYIRATVFVERESQKRILIGKNGSRIRELGRAAREKIEQLTGSPVYLDLWIKVLHNWRRNPASLHRFGFSLPEDAS